VTISCRPGGGDHFTTGGLDLKATLAASGGIPIHATATVKAKAWRSGWEPSWLTSATYTLQVATPTLSLASGRTAAQNVTVSVHAGRRDPLLHAAASRRCSIRSSRPARP
jgi:uncharacterized protein YfaP (DUF2135 family)